jgi:Ca2+-binding RTX toxin-like protein
MGDVIFLGENGFSPDFWDNARVIAQSPGASHILGFDGDDIINGAAGQDLIHGSDGDDLIYGWNAASPPNVDQLYGDDGDDTIFVAKPAGGRAAADMDGGDGNDTASFYFSRYGVTANLSTQSGSNSGDSGLSYQIFDIENLIGTDYDDTLTGDGGDNLLQGHVGNDTLIAGDGNDILEGGPLPPALYRVDAGGPTLRTSDGGPDWGRDVTASPSVYLVTSGTTTAASTANVLYDPADFEGAPNSLFTAFRTGTASSFNSMAWSLPVFASGTYTVNLFLAEGDFSIDKAGQRVFDVTVEGTTPDEFQDIDPWLLGGSGNNGAGNNAFVLSYDIDVTDTSLDLSFVPDAGLPTIFGIEIVRITSDDDILDGGDGNDTAVYSANSGKVAIDLTAGTANEYGSDAGTKADKVVSSDTLTGIENLDGSAYDDTIIGDENDNVLVGGAGDNTLQGGGGSDTWSTAGGGKAF